MVDVDVPGLMLLVVVVTWGKPAEVRHTFRATFSLLSPKSDLVR